MNLPDRSVLAFRFAEIILVFLIPFRCSTNRSVLAKHNLKYGFFPVSASGENVLKPLLERGFEFRGRSSQFLGQSGRSAALAWIIPVPPAKVAVRIRFLTLLAVAALHVP
jgi:hypothetical protein